VPIGDGPAPIVGVALRGARSRMARPRRGRPTDRTRGRRWSLGAPGATAAVLATLLLSPVASSAAPSDPAAGATAAAAQTPPDRTPPLVLLSQTSWVAPGQAFDLKLHVAAGSTPSARLGLSVAVFTCLSSVSGFDQSISSAGASGTRIAGTTAPIPVNGLPVVAGGGIDLSMPVTVGAAGSPAGSGGFSIDLTSTGGQCGAYPSGVYPVRVQLVDNAAGGQVLAGITTHLVYSEPAAGTQKLRFAVVLPVQTPLTASRTPTPSELVARPEAALAPPSDAALAGVTGVVAALAKDEPDVPVTLAASPQTVLTLAATGHQSTVGQLAALASTPDVHQFASSPYVPVDAPDLVGSGLGGELDLQVARGTQVLTATVDRTTDAGSDATAGHLGAWFTNGGMDDATLGQLQAAGYGELVLPASGVVSPPTNGSTVEPFTLPTGRGGAVTAVASSADLASRFTGSPGDPVLAAHQLVAELAQIYYEKPNDTSPRAVVAVAPSGWSDDPTFVDALLSSLAGNPIVQPVTTAEIFATLPGASCRGGCRLEPTSGGNGLPVRDIRAQRQRIDGLAGAAPTAKVLTAQLGDLVLAGESSVLRSGQQAAVLDNTAAAVDAQLGQLVVAGDRSITLTSQRGRIPVTIQSSATYPVSASLTLTSDKLLFANGTSEWTTPTTLLPSHTNVIYVAVQARASGLFKMSVALHSPTDGLLLSSGEVSVRSTGSSVVGVVLSVGAVVVLGAWWIRTSRKRQALRKKDAAEDAAAEAR